MLNILVGTLYIRNVERGQESETFSHSKYVLVPIVYVCTCEYDLTVEEDFLLYLELRLRDLNLDFHIALTLNERVDIYIYTYISLSD